MFGTTPFGATFKILPVKIVIGNSDKFLHRSFLSRMKKFIFLIFPTFLYIKWSEMSPPAGVWTKACLKYEEDDTEQEKKAILKSVNSARSQNISTKDNPFQLHVLHAFMISNRGDLMILYNLALILRTAFNWNHSTSDVLPPCEFG